MGHARPCGLGVFKLFLVAPPLSSHVPKLVIPTKASPLLTSQILHCQVSGITWGFRQHWLWFPWQSFTIQISEGKNLISCHLIPCVSQLWLSLLTIHFLYLYLWLYLGSFHHSEMLYSRILNYDIPLSHYDFLFLQFSPSFIATKTSMQSGYALIPLSLNFIPDYCIPLVSTSSPIQLKPYKSSRHHLLSTY